MDNFGGPAAWDRYCARQDEILTYIMENTTCGECQYFEEDGICFKLKEKVNPDDLAIEIDCEDVEPVKGMFYVY